VGGAFQEHLHHLGERRQNHRRRSPAQPLVQVEGGAPRASGAPFFRCLLALPFDQTRQHRDEVPGADERRADPGAGAVVLVVGDAGEDRRSLALALDLDQAGVGEPRRCALLRGEEDVPKGVEEADSIRPPLGTS